MRVKYQKLLKPVIIRGKSVYKFFKLERKIEAHEANLEDDYQRFQEITLAKKQQDKIQSWIEESLETTYVRIDSSYMNCTFKYADWMKIILCSTLFDFKIKSIQ